MVYFQFTANSSPHGQLKELAGCHTLPKTLPPNRPQIFFQPEMLPYHLHMNFQPLRL